MSWSLLLREPCPFLFPYICAIKPFLESSISSFVHSKATAMFLLSNTSKKKVSSHKRSVWANKRLQRNESSLSSPRTTEGNKLHAQQFWHENNSCAWNHWKVHLAKKRKIHWGGNSSVFMGKRLFLIFFLDLLMSI